MLTIGLFICCIRCDHKEPDYFEPPALATHFNGEQFIGSHTCKECHADIYASHLKTAHFNTSALASADNIIGSFDDGAAILSLDELEVKMIEQGDAYYQQVIDKKTNQTLPAQQMDVVIGSGVKGQSYLTWEDERLFQLQASYYPPTDSWINSPGYPNQFIKRPVRDGCLKCHVTFATNRDFSGQGNWYDSAKMVYGVDCEKCHRPAGKHVVFHRENPDVTTAAHMLKLDTLSRQLRLDACAQCHSGPRDRILQGNSFTYLTGEPLEKHSRNFHTGQSDQDLDVHGNQYGLLTSSQCFIQSAEMDCSTCHDPHVNQRNDANFFNQKCMSCHQTNSAICTEDSAIKNAKDDNCISCHMPTMPSKMMSLQLTGDPEETAVFVRTHLIAVYPDDNELLEETIDSVSVDEIKRFIGE